MLWRNVSPLDLEIDRAVRALRDHRVGSPEYQTILNIVVELNKQREIEKPKPISKDTLAVIGGNLMGILMIIKHEHLNVVTSRAMGLLIKPRI